MVVIIISIPLVSNKFENYIIHRTYHISEDAPILVGHYPLKKHMGVSSNTYAENSKQYPIFGFSYGQYTNNVRYLATSDNGKLLWFTQARKY